MSGTSTSRFTASGTVPCQEALGHYHRIKYTDIHPTVKLQAHSEFVPTAINNSIINIETRNVNYSGFRFKQLTTPSDTTFGTFFLQSYVSDGDGTNLFGFDGTNLKAYANLDMGGFQVTNLASPITLTGDVTGSGALGSSIATTIVAKLSDIPAPTSAVNMNSHSIINILNLGVGVSSPTLPLQFANSTAQCKICLYQTVANSFQVYGFGVNANILKYTVDSSSADHVFYCGASSTTSTELFRITGAGYATVSGGDGTFYSRVPSASVVITFNSSGTSCTAGTWRKPVGTTIALTGAVQFTTGTTNRLTFTGSDLSAACTGMASACATFALSSYTGVTAQMGLAIYKNGTTVVGMQMFDTFSGGPISIAIPNVMASLSPTDYLELWIMCNTTMSVILQEMSLSFAAC